MAENGVEIKRLAALLARRPAAWDGLAAADWDRLVALALQHGVGPSRLVPPGGGGRDRAAGRGGAAARRLPRQRRAQHRACSTSSAGSCARCRLRASASFPSRGACLAEAVYGNIALRPMGDIDLMVRPGDVPEALEILRSLGFESESPIDPVAEQTINHGAPLTAPTARGSISTGRSSTPRYHGGFGPDDLDGLWSRAVPATIAGVPVLMLLARGSAAAPVACTCRSITRSTTSACARSSISTK